MSKLDQIFDIIKEHENDKYSVEIRMLQDGSFRIEYCEEILCDKKPIETSDVAPIDVTGRKVWEVVEIYCKDILLSLQGYETKNIDVIFLKDKQRIKMNFVFLTSQESKLKEDIQKIKSTFFRSFESFFFADY